MEPGFKHNVHPLLFFSHLVSLVGWLSNAYVHSYNKENATGLGLEILELIFCFLFFYTYIVVILDA